MVRLIREQDPNNGPQVVPCTRPPLYHFILYWCIEPRFGGGRPDRLATGLLGPPRVEGSLASLRGIEVFPPKGKRGSFVYLGRNILAAMWETLEHRVSHGNGQ